MYFLFCIDGEDAGNDEDEEPGELQLMFTLISDKVWEYDETERTTLANFANKLN